jgi:hypothetical protein
MEETHDFAIFFRRFRDFSRKPRQLAAAYRIVPPSFHLPKQSLAISRRRLILETSGIAGKLGAHRPKSVPTILIRRQTCSSANR